MNIERGGNAKLEEPTKRIPEVSKEIGALDIVIALPPGKTLEPAMTISVGFGTTACLSIVKVSGARGGLSNAVSSLSRGQQ